MVKVTKLDLELDDGTTLHTTNPSSKFVQAVLEQLLEKMGYCRVEGMIAFVDPKKVPQMNTFKFKQE